jgi:hypothetical protein
MSRLGGESVSQRLELVRTTGPAAGLKSAVSDSLN